MAVAVGEDQAAAAAAAGLPRPYWAPDSESLEEESSPSSSSSESLTSEGPVMTSSVAPWVVALALRTS